jgi:hypothetical protein
MPHARIGTPTAGRRDRRDAARAGRIAGQSAFNRETTMNLVAAIEAFNQHSQPQIELRVTRDGRTMARLPRLGKEIVIKGTPLNHKVKVSSQDIALLCEEAQLAIAPGMALLEAGLGAMGKVARDAEDELA